MEHNIESRHNPAIKALNKLQKASERRKQKLFVVEGLLEFERAINAYYQAESVYISKKIFPHSIEELEKKCPKSKINPISDTLFNQLAYRNNSGGILAVFHEKEHTLDQLKIGSSPLLLVIEGIEKPGNIGALYRTADAVGVDAVILANPLADIYNPNAIRASIGTVFTVPTAISSSEEALSFLQKNQIPVYATYLEASQPYHEINYQKASAILVGTEATGISDIWIKNSNANIIIPMRGAADSLNVSVSAAIVLFEAARQRNFKLKSE